MRRSLLIFVLAGLVSSLAVSTYAQETLWKELTTKVTMLRQQGRYTEAAKVAEEALSVAEKTFGPDHPAVAISLNNLAELYRAQGKYAKAEHIGMVREIGRKAGSLQDKYHHLIQMAVCVALRSEGGAHSHTRRAL